MPQRALTAAVGLAPFLVFLVCEALRPFPFTTTNDNWSYFLPLLTRVTDSWLDGAPLRIVWEVGQGWAPWESGQAAWLSPVPVFSAFFTRTFADPIWLLEVDAGVHILLLGAAAVWAPPTSFSPTQRQATALLLSLAPGPLLIGMNWHNYLMPAPWFLVLLGFVWRALDRDRGWSARESVVVVVASLLFFSAAHPQMMVIGCGFLALFAVGVAKNRLGVEVVLRLALAQLPVVPPLLFLWLAAANAPPIWMAQRARGSFLDKSLAPLEGLLALVTGPTFVAFGGPFFLPLVVALVVFGVRERRRRLVAVAVFIVILLVPRLFPPIDWLMVGPLASFRFVSKLTVYAGPVVAALFMSTRWRWRSAVAVVVAVWGALVVVAANDEQTTMNAAHVTGAAGLRDLGRRCLDEAGVKEGERLAFIGDLLYQRDFGHVPLGLVAMMNQATLTLGRESANLYEPLEPKELFFAHGALTAWWRNTPIAATDEVRLQALRNSGVRWLVSVDRGQFDGRTPALPKREVCGLFFAELPDARPFLPDLERSADGTLTTPKATAAPPPASLTARSLHWQRQSDGRWQSRPALPGALWLWGSLAALVLGLVAVTFAPRLFPGLSPPTPRG